MTTIEAKKHFGGTKELAKALDIWPTAVSRWGKYPPKLRQMQIEMVTEGKLKASDK